ncbi:peptidoglycan D,D-transpeptidase FtsI family protein [Oligella urethralis]|uniref:Peptidoglycan D,D-transpeptidase FtsI n=1 Tax=Oligella urethralis TaxID=90245 RepID=A0A2X1WKS0_9BURK|nr:penicillin-binding protein 2 [Oligella urethralis]SPY09164.1 Penicillin-binding protein 2 [Oligella urethralis]
MKLKKVLQHIQRSKSRNTRGYKPQLRFFNEPVIENKLPKWRSLCILGLFVGGFTIVLGQAFYHQIYNNDFLRAEGEKRFEVNQTLPANRGRIEDRNGVFLATSVPVRAVWIIPEELQGATPEQFKFLAESVDLSVASVKERMENHMGKTFVYLKRQVPMDKAESLREQKLPGVYFLPEVKRSYPQGPITAHLVGFTNIENNGIEGIEKHYESRLSGVDGNRTVLRDRLGRVIQDVYAQSPAQDGENVRLTIDSQIQYLSYQALEKAVKHHAADSGGAVVIDTQTGEILSMVSYPSYDPNDRSARKGALLRNRAVTDVFEPGSIIKPLVAALALDAKAISLNTKFATGNGSYRYQGHTITDVSRYNGTLDVAGVIRRSSNIGMTMIAERLRAEQMWTVFKALGFGTAPEIGFPGIATGNLRPWERWRLIEKATMSYGYGVSTSLLQIAHAYTTLARDGDMVSLSLIRSEKPAKSVQIFSKETARNVRRMLEETAGPNGSKIQAMVEGYRIGGKSGTARKIVNGKYSRSDYRGSFVAVAPISNPRIVVAVTVDNPRKAGYFGTLIAGPATGEIISGTLKYLSVPPDLNVVPTLEANNSKAAAASARNPRG